MFLSCSAETNSSEHIVSTPVCQSCRQSSRIPFTPVRTKRHPTHTAADCLAWVDLADSVTLQVGTHPNPRPLRAQHRAAWQVRCTICRWLQLLRRVISASKARRHSTGNQTCTSRNPATPPCPSHQNPGKPSRVTVPSQRSSPAPREGCRQAPQASPQAAATSPPPLPPHSSSPPRVTCHGHKDSNPSLPDTQSTHPAAAPTEAPDSGTFCSEARCPYSFSSPSVCLKRYSFHAGTATPSTYHFTLS